MRLFFHADSVSTGDGPAVKIVLDAPTPERGTQNALPVESNLRLLETGDELLVAEWRCPGSVQSWREACSLEHGIELQKEGVHLRRSGSRSVSLIP